MSNEQFIADVYWWAEHLPGPPTPWLDGLKRLLTEAADRLAVPPEGVRPPQQIDLPEEAAKVLRENLWELYGGQAAEGAQGWQPIATAPKDGTNFLAVSYASSVFLAHWANGVVDSCSYDNDCGYSSRFATHWMPLPEPPKADPPAREETP